MTPWYQRKLLIIPTAVLSAVMVIACGSSGDTGSATDNADDDTAQGAADTNKKTDGVYKFGETVKFKDGSTISASKPTDFTREQVAIGGEGAPEHVKFKMTFKNNTDEIFDPTLTTAAASADGEEGDQVFQDGMNTPSNKILPGKSTTWTVGYGIKSKKDLQLQVTVGFLDYGTVIFTG